MVRVRFAPSPTGRLHIGSARTALFNWLYARAKKGSFILRIEDTDRERSKKEYLDQILESLKWLGFDWDELYFQSKRLDIYKEYAQKLLNEGKAYLEKPEILRFTQDTSPKDTEQSRSARVQKPEDKDKKREAIIFKVQPQKVKIKDLIHGEIEFDTSVIKDQVLIKSDGTATYNFACVVDDGLLGITHIIRGDDHISNTPKQILLYSALGFNTPQFAHIPLILGKDGSRLSKRTGATAISEYKALGYLSPALVNYLLLLGWSPGQNREIISITEAIKAFEIEDVNKTAAIFDLDKLNWINNHYIKESPTEELLDLLWPLLQKRYPQTERSAVSSVLKLYQGRINNLLDFLDWADFFFLDEIEINEEAKAKFLEHDLSKEFSLFIEGLDKLEVFNVENIERVFRDLVKELNITSRKLIHPIRVALTGKTIGPGLFDVIHLLGKERVKKRLKKWVREENK